MGRRLAIKLEVVEPAGNAFELVQKQTHHLADSPPFQATVASAFVDLELVEIQSCPADLLEVLTVQRIVLEGTIAVALVQLLPFGSLGLMTELGRLEGSKEEELRSKLW